MPPAPAGAATNLITTVAGTGTAGFGGDGGPATAPQLNFPIGVAPLAAADGGGYLIADEANDRIRRLGAGGNIRTVAGSNMECNPASFMPNDPADPCGD